jgi:short-subunit dehydrogenase
MVSSQAAMVTGASSGIGEAYAQRLASDGRDLTIVARREDRLSALAARLREAHGVTVDAIPADLADAADLRRVCELVEAAELDMLVNNAGLAHYKTFAELPPSEAEELVLLNVLAPVLLSRAAVPGMLARGSGAIVNVASLLAFSGSIDAPQLPRRAVYAGTKSFLVTFSETLASELAPAGIRVQVVCPGVVRSEFHTRQGMDLSAVPRMEPEDVVEASLADLERGAVVSIPGLAELDAYARLEGAEEELVAAARTAALPGRYREA